MAMSPNVASATTFKKMPINLPSSKPQANVASYLEEFRKLYLQQALANALQSLDLRTVNEQLDQLAPAADLRQLASRGIEIKGADKSNIWNRLGEAEKSH